MRSICVIALVAWSCLCARANISFVILAGDLQTANGTLMSTAGQVVLVASTADGVFGGPTAADFVTGDDVVLFRGDLLSGFGDGVFSRSFSIDLISPLSAGDPVQLYWFPTLTASSTSPGAGTTYGFYRDAVGIDSSDPWLTPGEGNQVSLRFLTESEGGSNPETVGRAGFTVVPEMSNLITAGLALGLCLFRFTRSLRQKS